MGGVRVRPCREGKFLKAVSWFLVLQQKACYENLLTGILMALVLEHFFKLDIYSLLSPPPNNLTGTTNLTFFSKAF